MSRRCLIGVSGRPNRRLVLGASWAYGIPGGLWIWFLHWISDPAGPAGPAGLAASNATMGTTLP